VSEPYFKFFADFDYKSKKPIEREEILAICQIMAKSVANFFPDLKASPIDEAIEAEKCDLDEETNEWLGAGEGQGKLKVLVSMSTRTFDEDKKLYVVGVHVNWIGNLIVTREQATMIRRYCIAILNAELPRDDVPWNKIYDAGPYTSSGGGLRMIGASKNVTCDKCKGEKYENYYQSATSTAPMEKCKFCNGTGKLDQIKTYFPIVIYNGQGKIDRKLKWLLKPNSNWSRKQCIYATTLRVFIRESDDKFIHPEGFVEPSNMPADPDKFDKSEMRKMGGTIQVARTSGVSGRSLLRGESYAVNAPEVIAVLKEIARHEPIYSNLAAFKMFRPRQDLYRLEVRGLNDSYCLRKGSKHSHDRVIYFLISPNHITQECYNSECAGEVCSFPYSAAVKALLFDIGAIDQVGELTARDFFGIEHAVPESRDQILCQSRQFAAISLITSPTEMRDQQIRELKRTHAGGSNSVPKRHRPSCKSPLKWESTQF